MTSRTIGRHRRPGRLSTTTHHLTRSAAIAATSTGLIAGTAVSATAVPELGQEPVSLVQEPVATPTESLQQLIEAGLLSDRVTSVERPARAVAAPEDVDVDFGTSGFTAVTRVVEAPAQPEAPAEAPAQAETPAPADTQTQAAAAVQSRTETSASRDNARTAPATPAPSTPAPSTPAPQPAPEPAPAPAPEPAPAPVGGGVLGVAAAYTGYPYLLGGASPATGFDCSGYTSFVFAQVGISLPRTAAAQQASATPVSSPQPGDLVFFGYPAYHVGIYAGGGMMYDSGRPGIPTQYRAVFSGVSGYGRVG